MGRGRKTRGSRSPVRHARRPSITGVVHLANHGGIVDTAEGAFKLSSRSMREVMDGDTVAVSIHRGGEGGKRAHVESVVERASQAVVGTFGIAGPLGIVRPLDTRVQADFFVPPRDSSAERLGVELGDVVRARIISYPSRYESGVVTIEERLGGADTAGVGIQCVMARYGLEDGYPEAAVTEAASCALDVETALADPLRRDVRALLTCTIDPVDARDFDDALTIGRTVQGGFHLYVHIADVSHYVGWGSAVDLEARRRATSVYLADRVLPMLPEHLSCDLCSLRPGEDRLAMTVEVVTDERARVISSRVYPSVISSDARLTYDEVAQFLGGSEAPESISTVEGLGAALRLADEFAHLRQELRRRRGSVDFDTVEVHALLDEAGEPYALVQRTRSDATSLVEEAMLVANECVAAWMARRKLVSAYRVHDAPTPERLQDAASVLVELGAIPRTAGLAVAAGSQEAMQRVLADAAGTPASELVNALLLRAMQRAVYRPANEGHYALGADAYCHFTSPIRRYPDLIVHRSVKARLARERLGARELHERAPWLVGAGKEGLEALAPHICRHSSEEERRADAAARDSQKVEVARYFANRIGEQGHAIITWASERGAMARLEGIGAEGFIALQDLGDEWFDFDERSCALVGAQTGRCVRPGMRALVEVVDVNPVRGHLDLALVTSPRALH